MWKTPNKESLIMLIEQDMSNPDIASYYECSVQLIKAYLLEFKLSNSHFVSKSLYKGEVGHTIEQHKSPNKTWRKRFCLSCEIPFQSEGNHNRICDTCKHSTDRSGLSKQNEGN